MNAAAIGILVAFTLGLMFRDTYRMAFRLRAENSPVENATFALFLVAGILGLRLARRMTRQGRSRDGWFYTGFGILALVSALEEISWGQSWFDYRTPWGLRDVNVQGELNVHNLPGAMELNLVVLFVFGALLLVGIALGAKPAWRRVAVPSVLLPIAVTITLAGAIQVVAEKFLTFFTFDMIVTSLAEVVELLIGLSCALYAWWNGRRLRIEDEHGARPRAGAP